MGHPPVVDIEVVEDFTPTARCDEGFIQVRRMRCRNVRADGTHSPVYRVDVVDRPRLDAVAVLVHRRGEGGVEVLTRMNLRPAAHFRKQRVPPVADGRDHLHVEEIVAGLLEDSDTGEAGLRRRAAEEVREEAGITVSPDDIQLLGAPFFLAPGILSEKIFVAAVDVTGRPVEGANGDGTPLEEGSDVRWRKLEELLSACRSGEIQDAKTEIAAARFSGL